MTPYEKLYEAVEAVYLGSSQAFRMVREALGVKPRNCDIGTPEEQTARFKEWCGKRDCSECPFKECEHVSDCQAGWEKIPVEEEEKE